MSDGIGGIAFINIRSLVETQIGHDFSIRLFTIAVPRRPTARCYAQIIPANELAKKNALPHDFTFTITITRSIGT